MPIHEWDPWRFQFFDHVPCPAHVRVPTEDADCYAWFPAQRWVHNKLLIAESQGLNAAPHGVEPPGYPVFSKPIYNMRGMGPGSRVVRGAADMKRAYRPGHMWMTLLEGEHVSTDLAVADGAVRWRRHATGVPTSGGMFDHWIVEADGRPALEAMLDAWVARHLKGYTGMLNAETIGGRIIEVHLRFADQWPDLYGPGWVEALVGLYAHGRWDFADADRRTGYSVVLFGRHGVRYRHPPAALQDEIRATPGVSSLQITFHEDKHPSQHSMPPGGFRLALVNCWDRALGRALCDRLAPAFWATQRPTRRRKPAFAETG